MTPNSELQSSIQNLWEIINSISSTLAEFNEQKRELREANSELSDKNTKLFEDMANIQIKLEQSSATHNNANERINALEASLANKDNIINDLRIYEQELIQLKSDFANLKTKYDSSLVRNANLETEVSNMKTELAILADIQTNNDKLQEDIRQLSTRCEDFDFSKQEIVRKNKDIYEKNNEIKTLRDKVAELESKTYKLDQISASLSTLQDKERSQREKIEELSSQVSMLNVQLEIEKKKLDDRTAENKAQIEILQQELREARSNNAELSESFSEINKKHLSLMDSHNTQLNNHEDSRAIILQQKNKIEMLNSQIFDYILDIEKYTKMQSSEMDINLKNMEYLSKIKELEDEVAESSDLREIIEIKNKELSKAIEEIQELNNSVNHLHELNSKQQTSIDDYKSKLEAKLINEAAQDTFIHFYTDECDLKNKEIKELTERNKQLTEENAQFLGEITNLRETQCLSTQEDIIRIENLELELAQAKEKYIAQELNLSAKQDALLKMADEKRELQNTLKNNQTLANNSEEISKEMLDLEEENSKLKEEIKANNGKIKEISKETDSLRKENEKIKSQLEKQNKDDEIQSNEINELKAKLSKATVNLNRVQLDMQSYIDKRDKTQNIKNDLINYIEEFINNIN